MVFIRHMNKFTCDFEVCALKLFRGIVFKYGYKNSYKQATPFYFYPSQNIVSVYHPFIIKCTCQFLTIIMTSFAALLKNILAYLLNSTSTTFAYKWSYCFSDYLLLLDTTLQ